MAAICKRNHIDAQICDLSIKDKSLKYMLNHFKPDIVAIPVFTYPFYKNMLHVLKI